jgi:outer membrane protein assembly factor BamD
MRCLLLLFLCLFVHAESHAGAKKKRGADINVEYDKAVSYYESGKYYRARRKFEKLLTKFDSYHRRFDIKVYMAYCDFYEKDYMDSAHAFGKILTSYPNNDRGEELMYMEALSLYKESPHLELDQTVTYSALDVLEDYLEEYPKGGHAAEVSEFIEHLKRKLAMKVFEAAKLYYRLDKYMAALVTLNNLRKDYDISFMESEVVSLTRMVNENMCE